MRISTNPVPGRLEREADLLPQLPGALAVAPIVAHGRTETMEWLIQRRMPGQMLTREWLEMDGLTRRTAVRQVAEQQTAVAHSMLLSRLH